MKIKKIEIENFRGIDSLKLDFVDPWGNVLDLVALAGPNGCGKTSVLEACVIGCHPVDHSLSKYGIHDKDVRWGTKQCSIKLFIENQEEEIINSTKTIEKNNSGSYLQSFAGGQYINNIEYFSSWRWPKLIGSVSVTSGQRRKETKPTEENRLEIIKKYIVNLRARKAFESEREHSNLEEVIFKKINTAWKMFYPEREQIFNPKTAGDKVEEGFDIFLIDSKSNRQIPIDSLSSGEIEIFTMLSWFAIQEEHLDIVLIDEPELHLHPAWHRIVIHALKTVLPNTQIICATHSDEILDAVKSYQRRFIFQEDDPVGKLIKSGIIGTSNK